MSSFEYFPQYSTSGFINNKFRPHFGNFRSYVASNIFVLIAWLTYHFQKWKMFFCWQVFRNSFIKTYFWRQYLSIIVKAHRIIINTQLLLWQCLLLLLPNFTDVKSTHKDMHITTIGTAHTKHYCNKP